MGPKSHTKLKKEYKRMLKELEEQEEDDLERSKMLFRKAAGSWEDFNTKKFKDEVLESRKRETRNRVDL